MEIRGERERRWIVNGAKKFFLKWKGNLTSYLSIRDV